MRRLLAGWLFLLVGLGCLAAESDLAQRIAQFRPKLRSRSKAERQQAYDAYLRAGQEGRKRLRQDLLPIRRQMVAACRDVYLSDATQKKLLRVHKGLEKARNEALRVIFDRKIYPDANHGRSGQPIVNKAVGAVKAIHPLHHRAFSPVLRRFRRVGRAHERIKELDAQLALCGAQDIELNPPLTKLVGFKLQQELARILLELGEFYDYCRRCLRYNRLVRTSSSEAERKVVDLTNEYRIQLGIKPLAINERLVQAARKHSAEMVRLGYFAHRSPNPENRTPSIRARNEGYNYLRGENCCSGGSAAFAFRGWYNSSGHHRNMINPGVNEIGLGNAGPWTEDFGARRDLDLNNPPRNWKIARSRGRKK